jgi:hypothetical protein
MLDTARSIGYFLLHSRSGSPVLSLPNNSFEPIRKTTLGRGISVAVLVLQERT